MKEPPSFNKVLPDRVAMMITEFGNGRVQLELIDGPTGCLIDRELFIVNKERVSISQLEAVLITYHTNLTHCGVI